MFGGGAGHIADMIARMKANRSLLKRKRYFKQHPNFMDQERFKSEHKKFQYNKATKKKLNAIRDEMTHENHDLTRKRILILIFSILVTGLIISVLIFFSSQF